MHYQATLVSVYVILKISFKSFNYCKYFLSSFDWYSSIIFEMLFEMLINTLVSHTVFERWLSQFRNQHWQLVRISCPITYLIAYLYRWTRDVLMTVVAAHQYPELLCMSVQQFRIAPWEFTDYATLWGFQLCFCVECRVKLFSDIFRYIRQIWRKYEDQLGDLDVRTYENRSYRNTVFCWGQGIECLGLRVRDQSISFPLICVV
jgi:hypothetical protein